MLHIPRSRVYNNLDRYGNTSAGSVPLALDEAIADGRVKRGDKILLSGFGAGLAWAPPFWVGRREAIPNRALKKTSPLVGRRRGDEPEGGKRSTINSLPIL